MSDAKSSEANLFLAFSTKKGPGQGVGQSTKLSDGSESQGGAAVGCRWTPRISDWVPDPTDLMKIKVLPVQPGSFQPLVIPTLFGPVKAGYRAQDFTQSQINSPS